MGIDICTQLFNRGPLPQNRRESVRQACAYIKTLLATPYSTFGIILLSLTIVVSGCSETPSGGSGFIDVARGEPMIVDSALAIRVFEDRPDGITTTFFAEVNDQVYLWVLWSNITEHHTVKVSWYSPEDDFEDPFWTEQQTLTSTTGDKITWFYIDLPDITGEWFVEIHLDDDLFERSHVFWVE